MLQRSWSSKLCVSGSHTTFSLLGLGREGCGGRLKDRRKVATRVFSALSGYVSFATPAPAQRAARIPTSFGWHHSLVSDNTASFFLFLQHREWLPAFVNFWVVVLPPVWFVSNSITCITIPCIKFPLFSILGVCVQCCTVMQKLKLYFLTSKLLSKEGIAMYSRVLPLPGILAYRMGLHWGKSQRFLWDLMPLPSGNALSLHIALASSLLFF